MPLALLVALLSLSPALDAQNESQAENILIRNVALIDPTGEAGDRLVNILVRQGQLEVITEDKISADEAELVVNADGGFIRNRLSPVLEKEPEHEPVKAGWLAYTPPPLAVPLNYRDTSKWNRFETKYISGIFISGLFLDRVNWLSQDTVNESQVGGLAAFDGGEIRGFRLGFAGTLNWFEKPWIYTIFGATNALTWTASRCSTGAWTSRSSATR
jgi:phosphate-selective porin OprO/OprP